MMRLRAGWMDDLTQWFWERIQQLWEAIEQFFTDLIILAIEQMLEVVALAFESLPVPQFMNQYSIGNLLGNAGPEVAWAVQTFKIGECMSLLGAALIFRVTRKVVTFGKW